MSSRRVRAPARRAVVRWALRLLRREWRQHLLVVALITVAVAAALFGATAAYNVACRRTTGHSGGRHIASTSVSTTLGNSISSSPTPSRGSATWT